MNRLEFRRQFLLSSREFKFPDFWNRHIFKNRELQLYLYSHPDLNVTTAKNDRFELILMGYILDVYNPPSGDKEILEKLCLLKDFDSIATASADFNGRFAIIYLDSSGDRIFNDATGFREIYYGKIGGHVTCGSTSSIIGAYFGIQKSSEGEVSDFYQSEIFRKRGNLFLGTQTVYPDIYHLLPNHYLDLDEQQVHRFWPVEKTQKPVIKDAINDMSEILKGTFAAATLRDKLYQGITSGWDTRLLLAAAREHLSSIKFYFNRGAKRDQIGKPSADFLVAREIADQCKLEFESVELDQTVVDEEFEKIYYRNNALARPALLPAFFDVYQKGLENTITVSGTMGNEILRIMFPINRRIKNSKEIVQLLNYQDYAFLEKEVSKWIDASKEVFEDLNYTLIDLFSWEHFFGNWGPISASEQDIVREEIRLFNCRKFLGIYQSLPDSYRYRDYPKGHVKMIEKMWKELMDFDMDIPLYKTKLVLRRFGMEILFDKVYQLVKRARAS